MTDKTENGLDKVGLRGGKRTNLGHSEWIDDWWVGRGKDESCQFEGPWEHMAILAAKILRHPNTQKVAPNLYRPEEWLTAMLRGLQLPAPSSGSSRSFRDLTDGVRELGCAREWLDLLEAEFGYLIAVARGVAEQRKEAKNV